MFIVDSISDVDVFPYPYPYPLEEIGKLTIAWKRYEDGEVASHPFGIISRADASVRTCKQSWCNYIDESYENIFDPQYLSWKDYVENMIRIMKGI